MKISHQIFKNGKYLAAPARVLLPEWRPLVLKAKKFWNEEIYVE